MKHLPFYLKRTRVAFTLVEILVVIAIIALLVGLSGPAFSKAMAKANSMKCASNLRSIGIAASQAATDNGNAYPEIDQAAAPIYSPPGPSLITALGPYGIVTNSIQCPMDMQSSPSAFSKYGSSYEWDPVFDDEELNATVIYVSPTYTIPINSSRVRLVTDFNPVHRSHVNAVYGDGHVSTH
jgi:prepilin-type N-terminal cleavage/methylation domain-containing protein/prepilin-type processing-associated H-X9-DG protein